MNQSKQRQNGGGAATVRLAFSCSGLQCSPTASFSAGMLTGLLNRAKGTTTAKNEKRCILVALSKSSSGGFNDVYRSEVIEDAHDISPSLVAEIKCTNLAESFVRVRILYMSNLTGGRDVIVGEALLPLIDIVVSRHVRLLMSSQYLKDKALFEVKFVEPFRPVLRHSSFAPIAKPNPGNPFKQSYVFYHEEINTAPAVYCEEYGFETRISGGMVVAFLDQCLRTLSLSKNAWITRKNLEIVRQGQFSSLGDALKLGWHQVIISVLEARIPVESEYSTKNKSELVASSQETDGIIDDCIETDKCEPRKNSDTLKSFRRRSTLFGGGTLIKKQKSCDDSKPSTFVEVSLSRSSSTFSDLVGVTNTEYFTDTPVYGSNYNSGAIKHPYTEHEKRGDGVSLITEPKNFVIHTDKGVSKSLATTPEQRAAAPSYSSHSPPKELTTVVGNSVKFVRYVPTRNDSSVCFSLNQILGDPNHGRNTSDRTGGGPGDAAKKLAYCSVALDGPTFKNPDDAEISSSFSRSVMTKWITADISTDSPDGPRDASSGIELLVSIEIRSPITAVPSVHTGDMATVHHSGAHTDGTRHTMPTSSEILRDCREFEMQVGYKATDPLAHTESFEVLAASPASFPATSGVSGAFRSNLDLLSLDDIDTTGSPPLVGLAAPVSGNSNDVKTGTENFDSETLPRTDYPYPLEWLANHILKFEDLTKELLTARNNAYDLWVNAGGFRPSTAKKVLTHQAVPVNLHMQIMTVRASLQPSTTNPKGLPPPKQIDGPLVEGVLDALSCGCLSPHGLGFAQKKGLDAMENSLCAARVRIHSLKSQLKISLEKARSRSTEQLYCSFERDALITDDSGVTAKHYDHSPQRIFSSAEGSKPSSTPLSQRSSAYEIFEKMGREVLEYETSMLSACRRRSFVVSQALSVTVSAVLMKLTLVAEKHIPEEVCEGWLTHGFLLIFEGLLSVIGSERFMLEDTVSAVEALAEYQICILPTVAKSEREMAGDDLDNVIRLEADRANGVQEEEQVEVGMSGREVMLYLPPAALDALPLTYRKRAHDGGAVLKIVAVLFSQGIDIQQTLALAATSLSAMASSGDAKVKSRPSSAGLDKETGTGIVGDTTAMNNLQYVVNVRGLAMLEEYCCQFRPIEGDRDGLTGAGAGGFESSGSAAAAAKDLHDKYRSSLPSPTARDGRQPSRTGRNLVMAMNLTSGAASAAGSAVRAYGASYFKHSTDSEGGSRSTSSSLNCLSPLSLPSHPLLEELTETVLSTRNLNSKNVDLLVAVERACVMLGGCRVTFCKSGKDRTGMAVTYEQSRQLGERFGCGQSAERVLRDANVMRIYGVRILIAEKNIGRKVYSINQLQAQFLPSVYRPPKEVLEDLMRKDDT